MNRNREEGEWGDRGIDEKKKNPKEKGTNR